jgi:geranylgeranyl pyrophosphate synthase
MNTAASISQTMRTPLRAVPPSLLGHEHLVAQVELKMAELAGDRLADPGAQMIHEHLSQGGKRLRARLALSACQALSGRAEPALAWATAVELLHNASLVHDDVQDGDRTRRGRPALWARHGVAQAINAGDLLLMLPFRALREYPAALGGALVQILAEYAERTARGQIAELALTASLDKGWVDYFRAVSGKTGTLFALPVRGAAEIAGLGPEEAESLADTFGSIGVLYQLQDDLLDLFDAKGRGQRGSDIYEGRLSALVLSHLELHPGDTSELDQVLQRPRAETTPQDVTALIDRFVRGGAVQRLSDRIDALAAHVLASESLGISPDIDGVARALVARVLAPLQALKGAEGE